MAEDSWLAGTTVGDWLGMAVEEEPDRPCGCVPAWDGEDLVVDASDCSGDLAASTDCRRTVVQTLREGDPEDIVVRSEGLEYRYSDRGVDLLSAAGRFVELLGDRDDRLATSAESDPIAVTEELRSRAGPAAEIGHEAGFLRASKGLDDYETVLSPTVGITIGDYYVDQTVPEGASLIDTRELSTGSRARIYDRKRSIPLYALDVHDIDISGEDRETVLEAYDAIGRGVVGGELAASRAIDHVTDDDATTPSLISILRKHTSGFGILEDLFADDNVTDVYVTSSVTENPLRIIYDGETMATNVSLTEEGAGAIASRIRRTSGRSFSRASPTVDAKAELQNGTSVRVAGVTTPVADGVGFAFREQAGESFTLPELVRNGTMIPEVAGFLSVAIERDVAGLVAGTRGAGKTTLLGTLLYELTPDTRAVVIEDTPELPVDALQSVDRDVQALRTSSGEGPEVTAPQALRTALRLGDGALVVGEIRGEEANVLYEAMRVGANANAVLGTIHGDGAEDVYERVVSDLGVAPSSFGATDLVVTVQAFETPEGRKRRVSSVEEVMVSGDNIWFEPLYEVEDDFARSTGRIERGESRLVGHLAGPGVEYADIRAEIAERTDEIDTLASEGRTTPREVATAYADRG